jgi:hypothetical protein
MSRCTAVRLNVDVTKTLTVCQKWGILHLKFFVREIKSNMKESMLEMEIKWRKGAKKWNTTS